MTTQEQWIRPESTTMQEQFVKPETGAAFNLFDWHPDLKERIEDVLPDKSERPVYGIWHTSPSYTLGGWRCHGDGVVFHTTDFSVALAQLWKERDMAAYGGCAEAKLWVRRIDLWAAERPLDNAVWEGNNG